MTEAQKDALRIVLDLARDNALDPDDLFFQDEGLREDAIKQQAALDVIEQLWSKAVNG